MMKPNVCSWSSSFSSEAVRELQRARASAPRPPYGASRRSSARDHVAARGAGRERERDVVEAALHVERRGQRAAAHPEDAEARVVGDELAGADRVDVLGRQRDADDRAASRRRPLMTARDPVARVEAVAPSANASLASTSSGRGRLDPAARAQVQRRSAAARPASGTEISRPVAGSARPGTSSVTSATTRVCDRARRGCAAMSRRERERRALERREDVGEAVALVVASRVSRSESNVLDRYITNIATPAAITSAMASAWPFMRHRSRSSLRSSARSGASPVAARAAGAACALPLVAGDRGRRRA